MMKSATLAALLCAFGVSAQAGAGSGESAATFLRLEQGGRGIGMAGAYTAVADDSSAWWWNPAGAAWSIRREFAASYTKFVETMNTQYASVLWPTTKELGTFGASLTYMSIPGIDGFDSTGKPAGKLTANGYAASLGYARMLMDNLSAGANVKILGQKLATEQGSGFAADAGLQYRQSGLGLGISVQNMGPKLSVGGGSSPLPLNIRAGLSYTPHPKVILALDEEKPRDGDFRLHVGGEWKVSQAFALRAGFQQLPFLGSGAGYSMGVGYATALGTSGGWAGENTPWWEKKLEESAEEPGKPEGAYLLFMDYGFVSYGNLADTHRFTLGVRF